MITLYVVGYLAMAIYAHRYIMQWTGAWRNDGTRRHAEEFWFPLVMGGVLALMVGVVLTPGLLLWNCVLRPVNRMIQHALPNGAGIGKYVNAFYLVDREKRKAVLSK